MSIALKLLDALAFLVLTSTDVTELVATPTRHMITARAFLNKKLALGAAFRSCFLGPGFKLKILRQLPLVDSVCFCRNNALLILCARQLKMVGDLAAKAVLNTTGRAMVIGA